MDTGDDIWDMGTILVVCLAILGVVGLLFFVFVPRPIEPQPQVTQTTYTFSGILGMAQWNNNNFLGIGGVDQTVLTFKNDTGQVVFTFNQNLPVVIGQRYSVTYNETKTIYYNVPATNVTNPMNLGNIFSGANRYENTTEIKPISVILDP